jgi:NitT/TauT family transport system substrate-binding protein
VLIANAQALAAKKDVFVRYMKAYRETVNYMYTDPAALKVYADFVGISEAKAKRTRDEFFPKEAIEPDRIVGLDQIVQDAVALKFTAEPLSKAQLAEFVQILPRK